MLQPQQPMPTDKALSDATKSARASGTYRIVEMFYSLQGEGHLAGTPMVFVRFADCNLRCTLVNAGFACDTEFMSGTPWTLEAVLGFAAGLRAPYHAPPGWMLLTGGEPGLQVDRAFIEAMRAEHYRLAIETNGTIKLPEGIEWICVSPKSAEHTLQQLEAHEVKYVRHHGMGIPQPRVQANHYLISPAFQPDGTVRQEDLEWCIMLVKEHPPWALSVQYHKLLGVR